MYLTCTCTCSRGTVLGTRVLACAQGKKLATRRSIAQRGERQNRPNFAGTMNMNVMKLTFTAPCGSAHVCTLFYSFRRGRGAKMLQSPAKPKAKRVIDLMPLLWLHDMLHDHHVARKSAPGTIAGAEKKSRLSDLFPCRRTSQRLALDLWLPPTSNQRPNRGAPAS